MRLVILGATGRTGLRVVDAALSRAVEVVALVRDAGKLGERRARVTTAAGDVRDLAFLRGALRAGDAVVSALGNGSDDPSADTVGRGTEQVVRAMEDVGAHRLLGVVGAGILLTPDGVPRNTLPDYPPRFRRIGAQHQQALEACERSSLSWLLLGCPRIVDADATGRLSVERDHLPPGIDEVTTGDLAELLVRQAMSPTASRERWGVNQAS